MAAAVAFGSGDFGGGWTTRRAPVLGVSLIVNVVGLAAVAAAALLSEEPLPESGPAALAAIGGVNGAIGILCLYQGLAVGRMGVVAPVTGVLAAIVPVVAGVVLEGALPPLVWLGVLLAIAAVLLVTRAADHGSGRSGLEFAVVGGVGIGLSALFLGLVPEGSLFWALAVVKLAATVFLGAVIASARRPWRVPRGVIPAAAGVGALDIAGNGLFLTAAQAGALAVAAVLSSLYPVVTVILAVTILKERLTPTQVVGVAAAISAIVLIGVGAA
ncbi:MAG: EamA family transporter [Chloroflexota bacterium]